MKLVVFEDSEHYYEGGSDTYLLYVEDDVDVTLLWEQYNKIPYKRLQTTRGYRQPFDDWCYIEGCAEELPLTLEYVSS